MTAGPRSFVIDDKVRARIIRLVEQADPIFSFTAQRQLSAIVACLGIQAEIGGELDRLSSALGVNLASYAANPWHSEIIEYRGEVGIRLWLEGHGEIVPTEAGLAPFVNALSLGDDRRLTQIVLFPAQIADYFKARGVDLVIVREWVLRSGLVSDRGRAINYTKSNVWEISQNIALTQAHLMRDYRLAFFGTHDIADHLIGATREGIGQSGELIANILARYERVFAPCRAPSNYRLILSYLIAMVLDDLAQPRWYGSHDHELVTRKLLDRLESSVEVDTDIFIPKMFTPIIDAMRAKDPNFAVTIESRLGALYEELAA